VTSDGGVRRGLLVDFGGVLTTNVFASFAAFCEAEGLAPEAVREAFLSDSEGRRLLFDLELGAIREMEFEIGFAKLLGVADPRGLIERLFGGMSPDEAMIGAVRAAHAAGVRTGLVSNSWGAGGYDRTLFPELFDGVVISAEEGIRKPDPKVYELGVQRIGLEPGDCVFVDDLPGNLKPARAMGMATVHHVSAEQTIAELEPLFGVSLR
jgi:putative hydrolase of the HAD superfamily